MLCPQSFKLCEHGSHMSGIWVLLPIPHSVNYNWNKNKIKIFSHYMWRNFLVVTNFASFIQILKINLIYTTTYVRVGRHVDLVSLFNVLYYCILKYTQYLCYGAKAIEFDSTNRHFWQCSSFFYAIIHLAKLLLMIDSFNCSLMLLLFVTRIYFEIIIWKWGRHTFTQFIKTIISYRKYV